MEVLWGSFDRFGFLVRQSPRVLTRVVDSTLLRSIDSTDVTDLSYSNPLWSSVFHFAVAALCLCYGFVGGLTAFWFLLITLGLMSGPITAGCEP